MFENGVLKKAGKAKMRTSLVFVSREVNSFEYVWYVWIIFFVRIFCLSVVYHCCLYQKRNLSLNYFLLGNFNVFYENCELENLTERSEILNLEILKKSSNTARYYKGAQGKVLKL